MVEQGLKSGGYVFIEHEAKMHSLFVVRLEIPERRIKTLIVF
jgi:hypothetical protein